MGPAHDTAAEMRAPRSCGPSPRVASMAARCPPAEPPMAPMRAGSRPKSNAWSRTHDTLACTSSTAAGKGWRRCEPVVHRERDVALLGELAGEGRRQLLAAEDPAAAVDDHDARPDT